jgi:ferredoxin/flavodoxin
MKSIVIYFLLTSNTKKVAQAIQKGMRQLIGQCDIATIKQVNIQSLDDYDLIGLGSPVWGGVPPNFKLFIDNLPSLKGKHTFAFCTHGALPERFFPILVGLLAKKGSTVIGIRDWYGSVCLPGHPKPYPTDGHPDKTDLKEAEDFGSEMVKLYRRISAGESQLIPDLPVMPVPPDNTIPRPRPKLNSQKCRYPECHLCQDNCPQDAINLSVSPPVLAKKCRPCYFCEMICPEGAISADYEILTKDRLWRAENVYKQALEKAEAEGSFRRLVPLEEVGWNTPYYQVYNTHPRYVIPKENGVGEP